MTGGHPPPAVHLVTYPEGNGSGASVFVREGSGSSRALSGVKSPPTFFPRVAYLSSCLVPGRHIYCFKMLQVDLRLVSLPFIT